MIKKNKKKVKNLNKILIISLAIIILIVVCCLLFFEDARISGKALFGGEIAKVQKECKSQCKTEDKINYCCTLNYINDEEHTCQSDLLKTNCDLDCSGVCSEYCESFGNHMGKCANAGCSFIVNLNGGYCEEKK